MLRVWKTIVPTSSSRCKPPSLRNYNRGAGPHGAPAPPRTPSHTHPRTCGPPPANGSGSQEAPPRTAPPAPPWTTRAAPPTPRGRRCRRRRRSRTWGGGTPAAPGSAGRRQRSWADAYPSESIRAELSVKLDLTDRQLQMWFCHWRLKDRNNAAPSSKRARKDTTGGLAGVAEAGEVRKKEMGWELGEERKRKAMTQLTLLHRPSSPVWRMEMDVPFTRRHSEPPPRPPRMQSIIERGAISFVESLSGHVLGIEFDPLPPDAFGLP